MADVQNYKNHTRRLPPFHFFALPVLLINVFYQAVGLYQAPSGSTVFAVVVAAALFMTCLLARTQALAAQDRVIRLEMRLRLKDLLPQELQARSADLSVSQLVGLRFAGDAELPDLVRTVLKDNTKQGEIKKLIKQWVPDTVRV